MLIGVELPITKDNVVRLKAHNLMEAHDFFMLQTQLSRGLNDYMSAQYQICRTEVVSRLIRFETK